MYKIIKIDDLSLIKDMTEKQAYENISLDTVERLECLEGFDLIAFDWYDIYNPRQETTRIIIYFTQDKIIFICRDEYSYCHHMFCFIVFRISKFKDKKQS